jgi:hypothetical protein
MRKKFFVTDSFVDMHRSAALHMLYLECKFAVVSGQYLTTLEHALQARLVREMAVYEGQQTRTESYPAMAIMFLLDYPRASSQY